jgi:hypothetical protein
MEHLPKIAAGTDARAFAALAIAAPDKRASWGLRYNETIFGALQNG